MGAAAPSIGGWEPRRQRREEVSGGCLFVANFGSSNLRRLT